MRWWAIVFAHVLAGISPSLASAAYQFVDLHPGGNESEAFAIMPERQAGFSSARGGATLWNSSAASAIGINPPGFVGSHITGMSGNVQVGYGGNFGVGTRALRWNGTAASGVDITPAGAELAEALGIVGNEIVGYSRMPGATSHAILWSTTSLAFVDLNPPGYVASTATSTSGSQQAGWVIGTVGGQQAFLWNGTADSGVNLHPAAYNASIVRGADGNEQVGMAQPLPAQPVHAMLWQGSAASAIDLHPASGFVGSEAMGANGLQQVGWGYTTVVDSNHMQALLWSGGADSVINLHALLPAGFTASAAQDIDALGNVAGWALDSTGRTHAVAWLVPEPSSISLIVIGGALLVNRQIRRVSEKLGLDPHSQYTSR